MDNRVLSFGYEDTDRKIEVEIFGIRFEINKEEIINKKIEDLDNDNVEIIEKEINRILGENAVQKLNNKRKEDGYKEMTLDVELAVLTCIYKAYIETTANTMINNIYEGQNNVEDKFNSFNNRNSRRNYRNNKNYRNYRRY